MNLYAPPKAKVEPAHQLGELWRRGALVRMDRNGALPDRCVICNADAGGYRLSRKLYWAPAGWKIAATATPFVALGIGIVANLPILIALFWPIVIVLAIAHTFVRKKLEIDFGVCARHKRMRTILGVVSIACAVAVLAVLFFFREFEQVGGALSLLLVAVVAVVALAVVQSLVGVQAISVKKLSDEHAWLARTGKEFRAALPELPG